MAFQAIDHGTQELFDCGRSIGMGRRHRTSSEERRNAVEMRIEADTERMTQLADARDEPIGEMTQTRGLRGFCESCAIGGFGRAQVEGRS